MRNPILYSICTAGLVLSLANRGYSQSDLRLWYTEPAKEWTQALPIGNGRLGGMVFGGTAEDRYQLNEDTLWSGQPHDYAHDGAAQYLPQIRQLLFEGKQKEAEQLAMEHFMSVPLGQMPYQPFGDLKLTFPGHEQVENYRRELDLDTGIATTAYRVNGVSYVRQAFASYPGRVIIIRLQASTRRALSFTAASPAPNRTCGRKQWPGTSCPSGDGPGTTRCGTDTIAGTVTFEGPAA